MTTSYRAKEAFTLVELSIVILIIGLLIAGITYGTGMIKQTELRSIISEFNQYQTVYNNFQSKYSAVPGDMSNASAYFGDANCTSGGAANSCNGNGDGIVQYDSTTVANNEVNKVWKHIQLSGLLGISVDKVDTTSAVSKLNVNVPASKRAGIGYMIVGGTNATPFGTNKNVLFLGKEKSAGILTNSALTVEDAFQLDKKMDDGYVDSTGKFQGGRTGTIMAIDGADATANTCINTDNSYNLTATNTGITCRIGLSLN